MRAGGVTQHGGEVAGRDAAFQVIRDFALSADPAVIEHLAAVRWLLLPTCNPDRVGAARPNPGGIDINRDHIALAAPETRAIHAVIKRHRPLVIVDLHEARDSTADIEYAAALNPSTDPQVRALSGRLIDDYVKPRATAET